MLVDVRRTAHRELVVHLQRAALRSTPGKQVRPAGRYEDPTAFVNAGLRMLKQELLEAAETLQNALRDPATEWDGPPAWAETLSLD